MGVVDHVGRITAGRTHIHLQGHEIAFLAQTFSPSVKAEELQMYETAAYAESLHRATSPCAEILRHVLVHIISEVEPQVHDIHDGRRPDGHGLEERIALCIDHGVIGADVACDELLHHVVSHTLAYRVEERFQLFVTVYLERPAGPHADVRLADDGIACLPGEMANSLIAF